MLRARARELFRLDPAATAEAAEAAAGGHCVLGVAGPYPHEVPAAEALLELCAFLGSDIPRALLSTHPGVLPGQLAEVVTDALAYNRLLAGAARYSLIDLDPVSIGVHRLVQAVVRARLAPEQESEAAATAVGLIWVAFPRDSWEVATWPECARLLPHW